MVFAVHNFLFYYSIVKKRVCCFRFSFPGASGISVVIVPTHYLDREYTNGYKNSKHRCYVEPNRKTMKRPHFVDYNLRDHFPNKCLKSLFSEVIART